MSFGLRPGAEDEEEKLHRGALRFILVHGTDLCLKRLLSAKSSAILPSFSYRETLMRIALNVTLSAFCLLSVASYADSCSDVVADTIAEMRAGADGWWTSDAENLVRAAAGSACIKAQSGRYGVAPQGAGEEMNVSAAAEASNQSQASTKATDAAATKESEAKEEADDGSWSVGGLTFRSMSGSPTQKPYERQRQSKKEEE